MFISKNNEQLEVGMLVGIHFNARNKMYSVVKMKSKRSEGKVIGYITKGKISNAYQVISKSGQKNVIQNNVKNRHGFLVGNFEGFDLEENYDGEVYYNPYKVDRFVDKELFEYGNSIKPIENVSYIQFQLLEINGKNKPFVSYKN